MVSNDASGLLFKDGLRNKKRNLFLLGIFSNEKLPNSVVVLVLLRLLRVVVVFVFVVAATVGRFLTFEVKQIK